MDSTRKVSLKNVPECICLLKVFTPLEIGDNKNVKTLSKHIHSGAFFQPRDRGESKNAVIF